MVSVAFDNIKQLYWILDFVFFLYGSQPINLIKIISASTVDLMNGTMIVIARSMLSKLVGRDEIGKLFSLIAVLESFIPLGMNPVYATLYGMTVHTFSGSFIILSALLTIPPQLVYV